MDKVRKIALLAFIVPVHYFTAIYSQSSDYSFRHITPREGLSSQFVKDITRDSTGFMWFATATGGLCRYDGYSFKTYRNIPGNPTSLSNDNVNCILEIKRNEFLVGTYSGGMNGFNAYTEEFFHFKHDPDDPSSISHDRVNVIFRDSDGTLWIGTQHGLNIFHPEEGIFTVFLQFPEDHDHPCDQVNAITQDWNGILWIGTGDGVFQFDPVDRSFRKIHLENNDTRHVNTVVMCIYQTHDSAIWVGTNHWLYILKDGKINYLSARADRLLSPSNKYVEDIIEFEKDGEYQLWLSTDWGLNRYDFNTRRFEYFYNERDNPSSLATGDLGKIYYDGSGLLWIKTAEHGVDVLNLAHRPFINEIELPGSNFGHTASCFYEDSKGTFWVGSHEGFLYKFDRDIHFIKRYFPLYPDGVSYLNGRVEDILEDDNNNLLLAAHLPRPGVCLFNEASGLLQQLPVDTLPGQAPLGRIRKLLIDDQGIPWVGTSAGLFYLDTDEGFRVKPFYTEKQVFREIRDLKVDRYGNLWVASKDGLYEIKERHSTHPVLQEYPFYSEEKNTPRQYPRGLLESRDGNIWIGASSSLCRVDRDNKIFHPADPSDQWVNDNMIVSIVEDEYGMLWMNSSKGLIKYDPERTPGKASRLYDMSDGLPYDGYISTPLYLHPDGRIFVPANYGTQKGFYYFHPGQVPFNDRKPNVVITDFIVKNEDFESDSSISAVKRLTLRHHQNFFTLEFAALDFTDPSKNKYEYYLDGFEADWTYSGNRHYASYTGVPPGDYIFRVRGSNNDGYWNEEGTMLAITILPPPWKTGWAMSLYIFMTAGILVFISWYYHKRQQLKQALALEQVRKEKLEELDRMKSRFFANISHEFRTPLTLILGLMGKLIPEEKDEQKKQELTIMQRSAKQLHRLINQLLSLAKLESGKLKIQWAEHDLVPLIRNYIQSFESLARQKNIDLSFISNRDSIPCWVDREKMETVMNNLLSNAFKFTPEGGRISVTVVSRQSLVVSQKTNDYRLKTNDLPAECAIISIQDNGSGISPTHLPHIFDRFYQVDDNDNCEMEGTGIGLALAKELVELHHGEIRVESEVGKGTTFFVLLPLGREHLGEEGKNGRLEDWRIGRLEDWRIGRGEGGHEEFETRNSEPGTRNPELETQNSELRTQNSELRTQNSELKTQNSELRTDKPLLLIVEDNPDMRYYIRSYFEKDFQVLEAGNGREGILTARENLPDIIVSDVMMPEMNGIEFCRKIKSNELTGHIPVILLTARASKESRIEGLETGADDFITKPFDGEELVIRVNNLITQRTRLKERFRKEFEQSSDMPSTARLSMDQQFLQKAISIIEKHLSHPDFTVKQFAEEMALSRVQLHRKLTAIVGNNATEFIQMYRLNKAAGMIKQKSGTIAEIAYDVGFSSPSYFSECFRKQYGVSPSEYKEKP